MPNKTEIKKLAEFTGHQNPIYTLSAAPQPGRFFSAGGDKIIVEWNIEDPSIGIPLAKLPSTIYSLCICKNHLLAGTSGGEIHIINLDSKQEIKYYQTGESGIFDIKYSTEHKMIAASSANGSIVFIDPDDFKILERIKISDEKIRSISFNTIRHYLYAGCADTKVYVIDIHKKEKILEFEAHNWSCNVVKYDEGNDHLITASKDAHVRIWDIKKEFELIKNIPAHNYAIYQVSFNLQANVYITASRDKTVKLWDKDFEILARINKENSEGHINSVNSVVWLNEQNFISAGDDRRIILWEVKHSE